MDNDIDRWLNFAAEVEEKLQTINSDFFSEKYKAGIFDLLGEIQKEASKITKLNLLEKQECYFRINYLGRELRNSAYFIQNNQTQLTRLNPKKHHKDYPLCHPF